MPYSLGAPIAGDSSGLAVLLEIEYGGATGEATGILVDQDHVLTAAHALDGATKITVRYLHFEGSQASTHTGVVSSIRELQGNWATNTDISKDIAVFRLSSPVNVADYNLVGLSAHADGARLAGIGVRAHGYPNENTTRDGPEDPDTLPDVDVGKLATTSGTISSAAGGIIQPVPNTQDYIGQSGSGFIATDPAVGTDYILGVMNHRLGSTTYYGGGTYLTPSGFKSLMDILKADGPIGQAESYPKNYLFSSNFQGTLLEGSWRRDVVRGESQNDTLVGAEADDELSGQLGNDSIDGGGDADIALGGGGADTVLGGQGTDSLSGEAGADSLDGGDDSDSISGGDDGDTISGGVGTDTVYGDAGNDSISGGSGSGILSGGDGNDTLVGGDLDDHISAGAGANVVAGGAGNDWYYFDKQALHGGFISHISLLEPGDRVIWNGYLLKGGVRKLVDGEGPVLYGKYTTVFSYELHGYVGELGEVYRIWSDGSVEVETPDGNYIIIDAVAPGRGGLSFDVRSNLDAHESQWYWSNIVNDGVSNNDGLEGRSGALATAGPYKLPDAQGTDGDDDISGSGGSGGDRVAGGGGNDHVRGHAENDLLHGNAGNDTLHGGGGGDTLVGGDGSDVYDVGADGGGDIIVETSSATDTDVLHLADVASTEIELTIVGADLLVRNAGGTLLVRVAEFARGEGFGIEQIRFSDDVVWGRSQIQAEAALEGSAANDSIVGTSLDETFDGGAGNDTLDGRGGSDLYRYDAGDGHDLIIESAAGIDKLLLGSGLQATDLVINRATTSINDVVLSFSGQAGSITLRGQFYGGDSGVEQIEFGDGTIWTKAQLLAAFQAQGGTLGDDSLTGTAGADTLQGKAGNDQLVGLGDGDVYLVDAGDGQDTIVEGSATGIDRLVFGTGLSSTNVVVTRSSSDADDVTLSFSSSGGVTVLLDEQFADGNFGVEEIAFGDGVIWTKAELRAHFDQLAITPGADTLIGSGGADTINGGAGDDRLVGMGGGDRYVVAINEGADTIVEGSYAGTDRLVLGTGLLSSSLRILRSDADVDDVVLTFAGAQTSIHLDEQFAGGDSGVEEVEFGDGEVWTKVQLRSFYDAQLSTSGPDTILGGSGGDTLQGLGGDDRLVGMAGGDYYVIAAGGGADTIVEGATSGTDRLVLGTGLTLDLLSLAKPVGDPTDYVLSFAGYTNSILLDGQASGTSQVGIEEVQFGDGTVKTWAQVLAAKPFVITGTPGDDVLGGTSSVDVIDGGKGDDTISGGIGADTILYRSGDGSDRIPASFNVALDILKFVDLNSGDIRLHRVGSDLLVKVVATDETITVEGHFTGTSYGLSKIIFAGGTEWSRTAIETNLIGFDIEGGGQDQTISGSVGSDTLDGGDGEDLLVGGSGGDTYVYRSGEGWDVIDEGNRPRTEIDVLRLDGLAPSDVLLMRGADDLLVQIHVTGEIITVLDHFDTGGVESIVFGAGATLDRAAIDAAVAAAPVAINGTGGSDTLTATSSSDVMVGGSGGDGYVFTLLGGSDYVYEPSTSNLDYLQFGVGFDDQNVWIARSLTAPEDMIVGFIGAPGTVTVDAQFLSSTGAVRVDELRFGNGVVWGAAQMKAAYLVQAQTALDDVIYSFGDNNSFYVNALSGSDRFVESNNGGVDQLFFGPSLLASEIVLQRPAGDPTDLIISFVGQSGSLTIDGGLASRTGQSGVEQYRFASGVAWTKDDIFRAYLAQANTSGDDTIYGFDGGTDYNYSGFSGHDVLVETSSSSDIDRILFGPEVNVGELILTRPSSNLDDLQLSFRGGELLIKAQFFTLDQGVEQIQFANGLVWDETAIKSAYIAGAQTAGNDTIDGFRGSTDFIVRTLAGDDVLYEQNYSGVDRLILGPSLTSSLAILSRPVDDIDDLRIAFSGGSLLLNEQFFSQAGFEEIEFGDGVVWNKATMAKVYVAQAQTAGNDTIYGFNGSSRIEVQAVAGDDIIVEDNWAGDTDRLVLGSGLTEASVTLSRPTSDLDDVRLSFVGGSLTLDEQFFSNSGFEEIEFGNGVVWSKADLRSALLSRGQTAGNDTIYGFDGATTFVITGVAGDDVLIEENRSGEVDILQLGAGLNSVDVSLQRIASDLDDMRLSFAGGSLLLDEEFANSAGFEQIKFGDGVVWTKADLQAAYIARAATAGADTIVGFSASESISGGGGADSLSGGDGADTIVGGDGADRLRGGNGADRFVIGSLTESSPASFDIIADFVVGTDIVDLSAIDANTVAGGDQAFSWIGTGAFTNVAGQLRYVTTPSGSRTIFGDVDGDGVADLQIELTGNLTLAAGSFIL